MTLHALAESKNKWIQRAKNAKELEQAREEQQSHRFELMAAKSLISCQSHEWSYANIARDFTKRPCQICEKNAAPRAPNFGARWSARLDCPKCAL
ncbi:hypothetical protein Plhal304r1_c004g0016411 [Plasmopara halstedii]